MKRKLQISAVISRLCTAAIALLGFSCASDDDDLWGEGYVMYGCPTGTFEIKGAVTDQGHKPVENAEIRVIPKWNDITGQAIEKTITDSRGRYEAKARMDCDSVKVVCLPADDAYLPDSTTVALKYVYDEDHKKSEWYVGHATATVDFTLRDNPGK